MGALALNCVFSDLLIVQLGVRHRCEMRGAQRYADDGFLVLPPLLDSSAVARFTSSIESHIREHETSRRYRWLMGGRERGGWYIPDFPAEAPLTPLLDAGVRQRSRDAPPFQPDDAPPSPNLQRSALGHGPLLRTLTIVPPPSGPLHGAMSSTRTEIRRKRTPLVVYSFALLLTSTRTLPAALRVELHTTALELIHTARRVVEPMRHVSMPDASDDDEKPLPCTVTGVPPSDSTADGST